MLKAHGDAKTFEIRQVRLNIEGITSDLGFWAAANTIEHLSFKNMLYWWCFWASLRPSFSNLHSSEEKFILTMQANDASQTSSPEMSWWLFAKRNKSKNPPATPCWACLSGLCALLPILNSMQQCLEKNYCINQKKIALNPGHIGRIPIYQHPPSLSKTPGKSQQKLREINHLKQINQHSTRSSSHFLHTTHGLRLSHQSH